MSEWLFRRKFDFRSDLNLMVGIERECFLTQRGRLVPVASEVIRRLKLPYIAYELSACQLESHAGPVNLIDLMSSLKERDDLIDAGVRELGYECLHQEVGPEDMPLNLYPDPAGRYQQLAAAMSKETLLAACRVTGTHIHVGMPDAPTALRVYNQVVPFWGELAEMGDGSGGQRLAIYHQVAADPEPRPYPDWQAFYHDAKQRGFADNPRNCWDLIRISRHGTIEFRMFGSTSDLSKIERWARRCWELCQL